MVKDTRFMFTVKDLMEILATLPPDLPVVTTGYETGYENFYQPFVKKLRHEPENSYYGGQFQDAEDCGRLFQAFHSFEIKLKVPF